MNKVSIYRMAAVTAFLMIFATASYSQMNNVDFLRGGVSDGVKIIQSYFAPYANAFGAGLNGGWYNTAKPHKLGGFDITATFNISVVPSSEGTFNVNDLNLSQLKYYGAGTPVSSTISGPSTQGLLLEKKVNVAGTDYTVASVNLPKGTNWKMIPVPMVQAGVGLPLGTELKLRYFPKINIGDGDITLFGAGLMHSLSQHIKGLKMLPLDISAFGGYTKLMSNIPMDLQVPVGAPTNYTTYSNPSSFSGQKLAASVQAWNVSLLASVKLAVLTVYGGIGYGMTQTDVQLKGNFPAPTLVGTTVQYNDAGVLSRTSTIPSNKIPDISIGKSPNLRTNIGLRLKLAVITIQADYTRSLYNVFTAGLGISFR